MAASLSGTDRPLKRGRTDVTHEFFQKNKEVFPKYYVIHSEEEQKSARIISPFIVEKSLTSALGAGYRVKKLASGDLLLELKDYMQYLKLSNIESIGDIPVSITAHRSLNTVRGVISENDFIHLTEKELLEGLADQNVVNVQRIKIRKENKEIPTKHIVLTFASSALPDTIEVGYLKISVRHYIPNPRRCFNCQKFGHGSQSCRGRRTCAKCASKEHSTDECTETTLQCANCEGEHPAYSRSCPTWKTEKEVITIKTKENLSYKEARQKLATTPAFQFTAKPSYSGMAQQRGVPHQHLAPAQATQSEPRAGLPAPQVEVAHAAPPPPSQKKAMQPPG